MPNRRRWIIVGVVVVGGILLVAVGIFGLRELLIAGAIPGEMLTRRVKLTTVYTTAALTLGLTMFFWCYMTGIPWARGIHSEEDEDEDELRSPEQR